MRPSLQVIAWAAALATGVFGGVANAAAPERWTASWIAAADEPSPDYSVQHFRRTFVLADKPTRFVVHASADQRYELWVNGAKVACGPARGDVAHWQYDTVDLAPHLRAGPNVLAATVWSFGRYASWAQTGRRIALLVQGDGAAERVVDTSPAWKVAVSTAWSPPAGRAPGRPVNGGERIDGRRHVWGWQLPELDDAKWSSARELERAATIDMPDRAGSWMLVPRRVPPMSETPERLARVRRSEGVQVPSAFPAAAASFTVRAHTRAKLLLDRDVLTTAFPEIATSGGRDAVVELRYAESLHAPGSPRDKGQRDEIDGKVTDPDMHADQFVLDGGDRVYRPLFWRTFRYVEVTIDAASAPVTVRDLRAIATGYPFVRRARFAADADELTRIREVGWRTARLCAHETYMDCPYYEQLQYVGDTRIQALVSIYETGDATLMRQALAALDESRIAEGLTHSRYPSAKPQFIPPFSLWWIGMLRDFWWYVDDPAFVRARMPGVRAVLAFFQAHQQNAGGPVGRLPHWNFVDWTNGWAGGVPPGWNLVPTWWKEQRPEVPTSDPDGASAAIDLQLLLALQAASELEQAVGSAALARDLTTAAAKLSAGIRARYWDAQRRLFADTPAHETFSQQANALAVLGDVTVGAEARAVAQRLIDDPALTPASIYFRSYVAVALARAGLGDRYLDALGDWRTMLARGLTTWAEIADPTRSDCHAWGASPNVELLRTVLGIDAAAPGFRRVRVRPHLGALAHVEGAVPHPRGEVAAAFTRAANGVSARVTLPPETPGELEWRGRRYPLPAGKTTALTLPAR